MDTALVLRRLPFRLLFLDFERLDDFPDFALLFPDFVLPRRASLGTSSVAAEGNSGDGETKSIAAWG